MKPIPIRLVCQWWKLDRASFLPQCLSLWEPQRLHLYIYQAVVVLALDRNLPQWAVTSHPKWLWLLSNLGEMALNLFEHSSPSLMAWLAVQSPHLYNRVGISNQLLCWSSPCTRKRKPLRDLEFLFLATFLLSYLNLPRLVMIRGHLFCLRALSQWSWVAPPWLHAL